MELKLPSLTRLLLFNIVILWNFKRTDGMNILRHLSNMPTDDIQKPDTEARPESL